MPLQRRPLLERSSVRQRSYKKLRDLHRAPRQLAGPVEEERAAVVVKMEEAVEMVREEEEMVGEVKNRRTDKSRSHLVLR